MTDRMEVCAQKREMDRRGDLHIRENDPAQGGISAATLKILASIIMLIDHIGAMVVLRILFSGGLYEILVAGDARAFEAWMAIKENEQLQIFYEILRLIGRNAFPVYCFFLVEGLFRTGNRTKYLGRMILFSFLSEVPFDLAVSSAFPEWEYQNVFFTLAIALLTMILLEKIFASEKWRACGRWLCPALAFCVCAAGMGGAALLRTDYGWRGVACILIMYFFRRNKVCQLLGGCVAFLIFLEEPTAIPAFVLLAFYRGKKGANLKYFFYGFYPIHLLLIYLVCVWMGIAVYPAVF